MVFIVFWLVLKIDSGAAFWKCLHVEKQRGEKVKDIQTPQNMFVDMHNWRHVANVRDKTAMCLPTSLHSDNTQQDQNHFVSHPKSRWRENEGVCTSMCE